MNRETVYEALFAKVSGAAQFVTTSRRLKHWDDVSPAEQPALFQIQKSELQQPRKGLPAKVTLHAEFYVYANSGNDPNAVPSKLLNSLMDAIEAALAPAVVDGFQTLGGTVSHCWIEGEIVTDEGVLGAQAVAIIPISILVNN